MKLGFFDSIITSEKENLTVFISELCSINKDHVMSMIQCCFDELSLQCQLTPINTSELTFRIIDSSEFDSDSPHFKRNRKL